MRRLVLWVVLLGVGAVTFPGCSSKEPGVTHTGAGPIQKRFQGGGVPTPGK